MRRITDDLIAACEKEFCPTHVVSFRATGTEHSNFTEALFRIMLYRTALSTTHDRLLQSLGAILRIAHESVSAGKSGFWDVTEAQNIVCQNVLVFLSPGSESDVEGLALVVHTDEPVDLRRRFDAFSRLFGEQ